LGAHIPSLARCALDEETLLILRVRRRLRGPEGALVDVKGPPKSARRSRPVALLASPSSAAATSFSSSTASSSSSAVSSTSSKGKTLRDHSKDLGSAPERMDGKRVRRTVTYPGSTVEYSALSPIIAPRVHSTKGGRADCVASGKARKIGDGESDSDSDDSVPIGILRRQKVSVASGKAHKGDDGECDSDPEDSMPVGKRQKVA
jgi:hypothetical protein